MKKNISNVDRILRVLIAGAIAVLYFTGVISGTFAIILGILAIVFLLTALINFCPLSTFDKWLQRSTIIRQGTIKVNEVRLAMV